MNVHFWREVRFWLTGAVWVGLCFASFRREDGTALIVVGLFLLWMNQKPIRE